MTVPVDPQAPDDPGRRETEEVRADRNLAELLQELRVAGLGVQVLFGFLLAMPFSARFPVLSHHQRELYVTTLLFAALSTLLLSAPVPLHRLLFRHHKKDFIVRFANATALAGLASVSLAVSGAVWLVLSVVDRSAPVPVFAVLTICAFVGVWFVFPLAFRHRLRLREEPIRSPR